MNQQGLFDIRKESIDVCEKRHGGSATSIAANSKVDKKGDAQKVLAIVKEGPTYLKAIARRMNKLPNQISGRISWLLANGYIKKTGNVVEGCAEYEEAK